MKFISVWKTSVPNAMKTTMIMVSSNRGKCLEVYTLHNDIIKSQRPQDILNYYHEKTLTRLWGLEDSTYAMGPDAV